MNFINFSSLFFHIKNVIKKVLCCLEVDICFDWRKSRKNGMLVWPNLLVIDCRSDPIFSGHWRAVYRNGLDCVSNVGERSSRSEIKLGCLSMFHISTSINWNFFKFLISFMKWLFILLILSFFIPINNFSLILILILCLRYSFFFFWFHISFHLSIFKSRKKHQFASRAGETVIDFQKGFKTVFNLILKFTKNSLNLDLLPSKVGRKSLKTVFQTQIFDSRFTIFFWFKRKWWRN